MGDIKMRLTIRLAVFVLLFCLFVTFSLITTGIDYFNCSWGVFDYENHFATTIEIQTLLK